MTMMKAMTIVFAIGLPFLVCSCANERVFYKGCVVCTATNRQTNDWSYFRITLGTPSQPYSGNPVIRLRSKNGAEIRTDILSVSNVLSMAGVRAVPFRVQTMESPPFERWPSDTKEYRVDLINFVVQSNRVVHIGVGHTGWFQQIGSESWRALPCTETDLRTVFGKPDRVYEWFRE